MNGFITMILGGGNPANLLGRLINGQDAEVSWCAAKVAAALAADSATTLPALLRWAAVEALNVGSNQRIKCPVTLLGSGRWFAQDQGGHYALLLMWLGQWAELTPSRQRQYERAGEVISGCFTPISLERMANEAAARRLEVAYGEYQVAKEVAGIPIGVGCCLDEQGRPAIEPEDEIPGAAAALEAASPESRDGLQMALKAIDRWSRRQGGAS
jgi:hypothetical protein